MHVTNGVVESPVHSPTIHSQNLYAMPRELSPSIFGAPPERVCELANDKKEDRVI
jgi:hypothetical protein